MLDVVARRSLRLGACVLGLSAAGCVGREPPGEPLGIFDVTEKLVENTCGATAVIAGDSQFPIELRRDEKGAVYWRYLDGQPLVGTFDGAKDFSLTVSTSIKLYAPGELDQPQKLEDPLDYARLAPSPVAQQQSSRGCTLSQDEVVTAHLSGDWLQAFLDAGTDASTAATDAGNDDAGADAGATSDVDGGTGNAAAADLTAEHVQTLTPTADSDCSLALGAEGGPFEGLPCKIRYTLSATRRP